jgi:hypothetical protein
MNRFNPPHQLRRQQCSSSTRNYNRLYYKYSAFPGFWNTAATGNPHAVPATIPQEKSMPVNDQFSTDEQSVLIDTRQPATPGNSGVAAYRPPLMGLAAPPGSRIDAPPDIDQRPFSERIASADELQRFKIRSNTLQSWVLSAMSWSMTLIVQGFAAYAISVYPGLSDPGPDRDHRVPDPRERQHQPVGKRRENRDFFPAFAEINGWSLENSGRPIKAQRAVSDRRALIGSALLRVRSRFRRQRKPKATIAISDVLYIDVSEDDAADWSHFDNPTRPGHPYGW